MINATPVITTATDINMKFAIDVFAKKNNFVTDAQTIYKTAVSQVEVDHTSRNGYVIYESKTM